MVPKDKQKRTGKETSELQKQKTKRREKPNHNRPRKNKKDQDKEHIPQCLTHLTVPPQNKSTRQRHTTQTSTQQDHSATQTTRIPPSYSAYRGHIDAESGGPGLSRQRTGRTSCVNFIVYTPHSLYLCQLPGN